MSFTYGAFPSRTVADIKRSKIGLYELSSAILVTLNLERIRYFIHQPNSENVMSIL